MHLYRYSGDCIEICWASAASHACTAAVRSWSDASAASRRRMQASAERSRSNDKSQVQVIARAARDPARAGRRGRRAEPRPDRAARRPRALDRAAHRRGARSREAGDRGVAERTRAARPDDPAARRFGAHRLRRAGAAVPRRSCRRSCARPSISRRSRSDHLVFIDQVIGSQRLRTVSAVGETFPLLLHGQRQGLSRAARRRRDRAR